MLGGEGPGHDPGAGAEDGPEAPSCAGSDRPGVRPPPLRTQPHGAWLWLRGTRLPHVTQPSAPRPAHGLCAATAGQADPPSAGPGPCSDRHQPLGQESPCWGRARWAVPAGGVTTSACGFPTPGRSRPWGRRLWGPWLPGRGPGAEPAAERSPRPGSTPPRAPGEALPSEASARQHACECPHAATPRPLGSCSACWAPTGPTQGVPARDLPQARGAQPSLRPCPASASLGTAVFSTQPSAAPSC